MAVGGGDVPRPPMIRTAGLSAVGDEVEGLVWFSAVWAMVAEPVRAWDRQCRC